jgi:hypothetical protein
MITEVPDALAANTSGEDAVVVARVHAGFANLAVAFPSDVSVEAGLTACPSAARARRLPQG